MRKAEIQSQLVQSGIVAILRADSSKHVVQASRALVQGGIRAVEVTLTTPNALTTIEEVNTELGSSVLTGVGSVLDAASCRAAILAGAQYVITPVVRTDVIECCQRYGKPSIIGCHTPTEALTAHEAGADYIKIFPAEVLGPPYLKALKGPLPQLELVPSGGVTLDNVADFVRAGATLLSAGSGLVSRDILASGDWKRLSEIAAQFVAKLKAARQGLHAVK